MSKFLIAAVVSMCALLALQGETQPDNTASGDGITWSKDVDSAFEQSKKEWKPVLMLFTAPEWCDPCKSLEGGALKNEKVINRINTEFVAVQINGNNKQDEFFRSMLKKHRVTGVPTMLFFHPSGSEVSEIRMVGSRAPEDYLNAFNAVNSAASFVDTKERGVWLGKKSIRPLIEVKIADDEESDDLINCLRFIPSLRKLSSNFVWLVSKVETAEKGLQSTDPYTDSHTDLKDITSLTAIKSWFKDVLKGFRTTYSAEGLKQCKSCYSVSDKSECCGGETKTICSGSEDCACPACQLKREKP